jgi:SAM-dependent methyltransferase
MTNGKSIKMSDTQPNKPVSQTDLSLLDAFMNLPKSDSDTDQWLARLIEYVNGLKQALDQTHWSEWIARARTHPLLSLLHKDPYHRRAYLKPRGYAGDAVMLDMIYSGYDGIPTPDKKSLCGIGRKIFAAFQRRESCESIRERKSELTRQIIKTSKDTNKARVMSLACGHLREVNNLPLDVAHSFDRIVAFDMDPKSLAVVETTYAGMPVTVRQGRIKELLTEPPPTPGYDLVYSAGLFDYLDNLTVERLLSSLCRQLNPGGRLLVGNMDWRIEMAYCDVFQDWRLIDRSPGEMARFGYTICQANPNISYDVWTDQWSAIVWLELISE